MQCLKLNIIGNEDKNTTCIRAVWLKNLSLWFPTRSKCTPGCTATEDGWRLEILDLEQKRCSENKDADQLRG